MRALEQILKRLGEVERKLASQFSFGKILELSDTGTKARVLLSDGVKTDWLDVMVPRAGKKGRDLWRYETGEQVFVASPSGDANQGVILGAVFLKANLPPKRSERFTSHEGGFSVSYDTDAKTLDVDFASEGGVKTINLNATQAEVSVSAKKVSLNADESSLGVVTGECLCAFTGAPHPDMSKRVFAGKV